MVLDTQILVVDVHVVMYKLCRSIRARITLNARVILASFELASYINIIHALVVTTLTPPPTYFILQVHVNCLNLLHGTESRLVNTKFNYAHTCWHTVHKTVNNFDELSADEVLALVEDVDVLG